MKVLVDLQPWWRLLPGRRPPWRRAAAARGLRGGSGGGRGHVSGAADGLRRLVKGVGWRDIYYMYIPR